jgi:hypothetical protein
MSDEHAPTPLRVGCPEGQIGCLVVHYASRCRVCHQSWPCLSYQLEQTQIERDQARQEAAGALALVGHYRAVFDLEEEHERTLYRLRDQSVQDAHTLIEIAEQAEIIRERAWRQRKAILADPLGDRARALGAILKRWADLYDQRATLDFDSIGGLDNLKAATWHQETERVEQELRETLRVAYRAAIGQGGAG